MSQASQTEQGAARFDTFCAKLEDAREEFAVPGVGVGVLYAGEEYTAGLGVTNINHPLPVDSDTLFQIGSTTKTFTATLAMQLVEQGKLELDRPIQAYLPTFTLGNQEVAAQVTLRHLFTHHGGWIGDFFIDTGRGEDALHKYVARMVELTQENPLDEAFAYNNAGFNLAGLVIQEVMGKAYEEVMKERIFAPLGMEMSFFFPEDVIVHRTVAGHLTPEGGETTVATPWGLTRSSYPAGGILSNAKDQLRYARFHLGDGTTAEGKRLLKVESLQMMQQTQRKAASLAQEVGISWLIRHPAPGIRMVGHGGATTGQFSAFEMVPDQKFALALTTNGSRGRSYNSLMTKKALEIFLDAKITQPQVIKLSAEQLQAYMGHYNSALTAIDITINAEEGALIVATQPKGGFPDKDSPPPPAPPPAPFVFTGTDEIEALEGSAQGSRGIFVRKGDTSIRWLHLGGRIFHKQE